MTILLSVVITICVLLMLIIYAATISNNIQQQKILLSLTELITMSKAQATHYENLTKYVLDLTIVIENLSDITQQLNQIFFENSFKILHDQNKMFGGFSPDEIVEKMKRADYELSDNDIEQLRDLFMQEDDSDDELDDYGQTSS